MFTGNVSRVYIVKRSSRCFASSKSGSSFTVNMPQPTTQSWERGAKLVKNTDSTNKYLEHIRDTHDPQMHLKTLEDELKGTMSKALGNQGRKLLQIIEKMHAEREQYANLIQDYSMQKEEKENEQELNVDEIPKSIKIQIFQTIRTHNNLRKDAMTARWELLVHRQAVGFITNNHKFVNDRFPIPNVMELPGSLDQWEGIDQECDLYVQQKNQQRAKESVTRNFSDQLDWWSKIGRWR